jgi:hypothetical protein
MCVLNEAGTDLAALGKELRGPVGQDGVLNLLLGRLVVLVFGMLRVLGLAD